MNAGAQGITDQEKIREWVRIWKQASPELEEIRRREVQEADNSLALAQMEPAFNLATRLQLRESSGMVEMQRHFAKLRR